MRDWTRTRYNSVTPGVWWSQNNEDLGLRDMTEQTKIQNSEISSSSGRVVYSTNCNTATKKQSGKEGPKFNYNNFDFLICCTFCAAAAVLLCRVSRAAAPARREAHHPHRTREHIAWLYSPSTVELRSRAWVDGTQIAKDRCCWGVVRTYVANFTHTHLNTNRGAKIVSRVLIVHASRPGMRSLTSLSILSATSPIITASLSILSAVASSLVTEAPIDRDDRPAAAAAAFVEADIAETAAAPATAMAAVPGKREGLSPPRPSPSLPLGGGRRGSRDMPCGARFGHRSSLLLGNRLVGCAAVVCVELFVFVFCFVPVVVLWVAHCRV